MSERENIKDGLIKTLKEGTATHALVSEEIEEISKELTRLERSGVTIIDTRLYRYMRELYETRSQIRNGQDDLMSLSHLAGFRISPNILWHG